MSAHTFGPWAVRIGEQSVGTGRLVEVVSASGEIICCNEKYYPTPLDERDAPLIAAAPELLAALRGMAKAHRTRFGLDGAFDAELVAAEAAIAKAEGRA